MSEQRQGPERDHWTELAEQLGLTPGPAGDRPSQPKPEAARPSARRERGAEDFASRPRTEEPVGPVPPAPVRPAGSAPVEEGGAEAAPAARAVEEPDDQPRRGRRGRRGGRSRGRRGEAATDQMGGDSVAGEPSAKEAAPARGGLQREDAEGTGQEATERPDSEEVDTLSDWNVPSWAELIASLYRPER